ncbi:MAG: MATE family efflux transporter [Prevotella shahii]|jgi:MATE efflux family protein|uniref:MATE family efflux transporter n=1 Tax=Hoylesella shahii TaxID=228603 RepID=UPI001CAFCFD9|nr:MATE family efflux transporter [Hoylesella shahii]MBF1568584.1 MATE family efflux transporter [Hoylesella shahii]MBF1576864.1 MATE family efflux transporter [Hoylesella shahii]MBF1590001.1 MATE family efflux transporter [Hoylesella shahii]
MDNQKATLELGTKPVGQLLMRYAVPAIIAMTASSLYNMVDSIFIGQGVGAMAISGLAITFPLMNLSTAFGAGVGVGASSLLSVKLGQKDYGAAQNILGNTVMLNIITGISFSIISLLFLEPILMFFGASAQTLPYAKDYMEIILCGNVITHLYFGLNALQRAAGKPQLSMYMTIFTVILNAILDPIFIWPLGLGIRGAAYATVLSQLFALIWQVVMFSNKAEFIHFKRGIYRLKSQLVKNIIGIGMSPFSMNVCACFVVIIINNSLVDHGGDMAVGAYGIINRIAFIFVMITIGVNQGMQPIAGYNYGAMKFDRMMRVLKYAVICGTCVTTVGFIVGQFFPEQCVRLFTSDETLISLSVHAMRLTTVSFPIIGFQMVVANFFQSIGKAKVSVFLSLSRQLVFLIPMLLVLPTLYGVDGVWYSMPVADTISALVTAIIMYLFMRKINKQKTI